VLYVLRGANGSKPDIRGLPATVTDSAFVLVSRYLLLWQVSRLVPDTAVKGAVGGVKAAVYIAVVVLMRTLVINPANCVLTVPTLS
jgi:hypothetical protein